ncbi:MULTISPECIES: DNA cytosine methyltransferase [Acinetobacter]|jgi:DNA (cytosine-5)-methyltransferase 1|uniref:DNA cytosine methyltransferase n=1 Tax=Acinetobacter TaxID=469 RepID=UPI0017A8185D|nr:MULTISPECIES: DNA cytosine methyltransferase [Acinetobacter]MDH1712640.1 DNA cytosine methyltransferase [Acinetobacter johnsonii]
MNKLSIITMPMVWQHWEIKLNNLALNLNNLQEFDTTSYSEFMSGFIQPEYKFNYVSLFSSAGISDFGLKLLGGKCIAACELDANRRLVHEANISGKVFSDIREDKNRLIEYVLKQGETLDLVFATPPCQSFSTANSRRGKLKDTISANSDPRNFLFFDALEVCCNLKPKFIVIENVPNFGRRLLRNEHGTVGHVGEFIDVILSDYVGQTFVKCVSEFGVPQSRKRSFSVYIRKDITKKKNIHSKDIKHFDYTVPYDAPKNIVDAIGHLPDLDSQSKETNSDEEDIFHHVPVLSDKHYSWIANIPANSGKSAWMNPCESCGSSATPMFEIKCTECGKCITVRPHIHEKNGTIRSIKGFKTSYKRIPPDGLSSAITTNTNAFSSDNKLHPSQNRVLSVRECMLIQSIPQIFVWPEKVFYKSMHLVREMVGEALPPLVSYQIVKKLLDI